MVVKFGLFLFVTMFSVVKWGNGAMTPIEEQGVDILARLKALEKIVERQSDFINLQATQIKELQETVTEQTQSISDLSEKVAAHASNKIKIVRELDALKANSRTSKRTLKQWMKIAKSTKAEHHNFNADGDGNEAKVKSIQTFEGVKNYKKRFVLDTVETVAFEATVAGANALPHSHIDDRVIFETVSLNVGSSYHAGNGTFIAPIPGIYVFSTAVMMITNTNDPLMHVIIEKNGVEIAGAYAHGHGSYEHSSVTVVMQLQPGDSVFVSVERHDDISFYGDNLTSFMGFLLLPL